MKRRGLLDKIFSRPREREEPVAEYFQTLTAYTPAFRTYEGSLYEMELTRAAIHSFATHCSKLKPVVKGPARPDLAKSLPLKANPWQVTSQYMYRLATILACNNNAFIAPITDDETDKVKGYYPLLPEQVELREHNGKLYVVYTFGLGQKGVLEWSKAGVLTQHQYKDDFFGESNEPMRPTMELIDAQNQGIIEGIKQAASIRFLAKLGQTLKDKDIRAERERFAEFNLQDNYTGVMLIDQKYSEVKQLESKPFVVDAEQVKQIKESVYTYFGTSEAILQNRFTSSEWNAYYEGKIEPFALQAGLVHTAMTFSDREIAMGNEIFLETNRMQYLSPQEKMDTVVQLFDRGFLTHNQGLEIFNLPTIPDGDKRYIRLEYANAEDIDSLDSVPIKKLEETEDDA